MRAVSDNPKTTAHLELLQLLISWFADGLTAAEVHDLALAWNQKNGALLLDSAVMQAADDIYNKLQADKDPTTQLKTSTINNILTSPNPEFVIDEILTKNTLTLISGYTGTKKTFLLFNLFFSLLTKEALFNHFRVTDNAKHKILLVDEENPGSVLKDRFLRMGFNGAEHDILFLHFQSVKLDNENIFQELISIIEIEKPTVVAFDSLIRIHNKSENDASEMATVMGKLREIANLGITCLVIHHEGKTENTNKKKTARGSSDIVGAADCILNLEEKEDYLILSNPKNRGSEPFKPLKIRLQDTFKFEFLGHNLPEGVAILSEIRGIVQGKGQWGVREILESLKESGYTVGHNRLREILEQAVRDKALSLYEGLRGKKEYLPCGKVESF